MKHIVKLTVSNPSHDFISMRSRIKQQDYITEARNESEAINRAARHFRTLGFKVHSAVIVEQKVELPEPVALAEAVDYKALEKPTIARIKSGETKPVDRTDYNVPPGMRKGPIDKKAALEAFIARRKETVTEEAAPQYIEEKLTAADPASKWIHDFVHSDNPKFAGKSKEERIRMALGAKYASKRHAGGMAEEVEQIDELDQKTLKSYINKNIKTGRRSSTKGDIGLYRATRKVAQKQTTPTLDKKVGKMSQSNQAKNPYEYDVSRAELKTRGIHYFGGRRVREEVEQIDESSDYSLKHTGTTHPKDVTDDYDQPVKATHKSYDIFNKDQKVGELEHHHDDVSGHFYGGNLHGRNFPFSRNNTFDSGRKNDAHSYLDSALKSKWHTSKYGTTNEEVEQTDEARKMSRIEWRTGTPGDVAKNHQKIYKKLLSTDPEKAERFLKSVKGMKKEVQEEAEQIQENPAIIAAIAGELLGGAAEGLAARAGAGAITRSIARKAGQTVGSKLVNKKDQQANEAADPGETKVVNKAVKTKKASAAADRIVKIAKSKPNKVNMDPELDHNVKQSSRY